MTENRFGPRIFAKANPGGITIAEPAPGVGKSVLGHSEAFAAQAGGALERVGRVRGTSEPDPDALSAGFALVGGAAPRDEVEAALAVQMAGVHALALDLMGRAKHAETVEGAERFVNMVTKLTRTYVAQTETLTRRQTGGKQTHEVVYVDARNSQNIIGHVPGGGGGGEPDHRPHAPALPGSAVALGVPLRCEDPCGDAMPRAGDQG